MKQIHIYDNLLFSIARMRITKKSHEQSFTNLIFFLKIIRNSAIMSFHGWVWFKWSNGHDTCSIWTYDYWTLCQEKNMDTSGAKLTSSISHMRTAQEDGRARFKFRMPSWIPRNNRVRRIAEVNSGLHLDVKEVIFDSCITILDT